MSLKELRDASAARLKEDEEIKEREQTPAQSPISSSPAVSEVALAGDGRTKLLGARVPLSVHRDWQSLLVEAREKYPDLTTQSAMPVLIRLLKDKTIWQRFLEELAKG